MNHLSRIAELSAKVNELARAYIIEPQEVLREKIIACHLLISEIAYKGDPELDDARVSTGQEAFKPVLPVAPAFSPSATYKPDTNTGESRKAKDRFVIKFMRYYWDEIDRKWVENLRDAYGYPSFEAAHEQFLKIVPIGMPNPGVGIVSHADELEELITLPTVESESDSFNQAEYDAQAKSEGESQDQAAQNVEPNASNDPAPEKV